MRLLFWITALVLASAGPALAGPVAGLVAAVFAGVTVKAVALFALRLFAGVGLSILQQRRARRGRNAAFGLQVTATTRGELESETSIIGLYATKGHLIYHNSHGPNNKYYQTVIELGGLPGAGFNRVMVDGVYSELGAEEHPDYGFPLIAKRDLGRDHAWIRIYDGTQTTADPTLVAQYAEDPETPWTEAHIGRGVPYAILTMEVSSKVWPNGAPEQRYEARGIPFYDLRRDSTAGGTGPHRWNNPTTWEPTRNPVVKIYNILRGLRLYDGSVWGGEAEAEDLPGWNWVPAMNACDADLGGRPKYEAGYEIRFAEDTPHDVIGELQAACNAQMSEFGGFFYIQVDAPDIPVAVITDDDLLVTDAATKDPFPELLEIYNRVTAKYVSPGALWNGVPLDQIRNAAWEAEDGIARNFEMDLPAVFNPGQAGQLAQSALKDHRRWRRHAWPLPPDYAGLRPLNTVAVTSAWNDYTEKLFEVTEIVLDLHRLTVVASLRERDPEDFEIDTTLEIPDRSSILPRPVPTDAGLPLFDAAARTVTNAEGTRAHAAVDVFWDASGIAETIKGIAIECQKRETEEEVWSGTVLDVERGLATLQPVPPLTNLRVRAKALSDNRRGTWSAWIWVTTDDVRIAAADLSDTLRDQFDAAFAVTQARLDENGVPPSVTDLLAEIGVNIAPIVPGQPPRETLLERLDFETPQLRGIEDAVRNIEDRLVELDLSQFGLSRRLTDAGVYVDPTSGMVRIAGVDTTQERQALVEANFDALAATVSLKASLTEVNDAIAAAVLDSADLASLTELQLRVSDVEVELDAVEGTLTLLSDTLTVEGGLVTMTSVTGRLDSVEGDLLLKVDQTEFDDAKARLSDAEIQLQTIDGAGIVFAVSDQRFLRDETLQSDDAVAEGLLRAWLDGQGVRVAAASGRRELTAVVTEGLEAEAAERLTLAAEVADAQAQIGTESFARANADQALTSTIAAQKSRLGDAEAAITDVQATRVTAAGAVSAVTTEISASYGSLTALAAATAFAEATVDGIASGFVWKLGVDDVLSLVQVDDGITEPVTTARIRGDFIKLDGTVEVTGDFVLDGDLILNGSLISDKIATDATGKISNTRRSTDTGGLGTSYSTVLTHVASHENRAADKNMILFCRMQVQGTSEPAGNVIEYRVLRDGVLMSGVPPLKRDVRPGEVAQEFFGIKQRTTAGAVSTTYTLEARVATNGAGIAIVTVNTGTEMWTEEKSIAGLA